MSTTSSIPMESKSAKKRKAKAEVEAPATPVSAGEQTPPGDTLVNGTSGHDNVNGTENLYLKELSKNIRNLHKKLSGTAKADSVVEQNAGVSIDDLVAQKKLNADQKAQLTKKPALQAQLAQYEEQHKQFQNFAQGLEDKHTKEKATLVESHETALAQAKEEATEALAAKESQSGQMEHGLKVITGFLHAAAAMRQNQDQESDEARAFEGALLLVYQGNTSSLDTLKSLVEGSEEKVPDVEGNSLDYTFSQIKEAALKDVAALVEDDDSGIADVEPSPVETARETAEETPGETSIETGTDPTIAHAGLTELEDTTTMTAQVNGDSTPEATMAPEQTSTTADAANAVAESSWDPQASMTSAQTATGEDWVQVPRDPAETDNGNSQPATQQSTSNWADEAGAAAEEKAVPENDGFEQVRRERGGRGGRGPRGRGGRGGGDGRGRGHGRGRGRGRGRGAGPDRPAPES